MFDATEDGVKNCEEEVSIKDVVLLAENLKQKCNTLFCFATQLTR